ncbi:hypothetical protein QBC47DRAFT_426653 [Echria macrotheca]|uniref:Rhodopsin domain-containing protein n=1 Tax=Echria macrotheca TaxID=438768 RepID=A0AAJ0B120_9PEZI|nr:hypothetical protein QBC47DRAFT_426653 [Echria macrotheca]
MSNNDTLPPGNGTTSGLSLPTEFYVSEHHAYLSRVYLGVTSTFLFFCTVVFVTRIYLRVRPVWTIGMDDYLHIIGYCLSVVDWAFLLMANSTQPGFIPTDTVIDSQGLHAWLSIGIWGLAMTCLKVSIALTLLRIQRKSLRWRIFLFSIIGVQAAYGILNLFFNLVIACQPLQKAWDPRITTGSCVAVEVMLAASNIGSGINIGTDVLLALSPIVFLRKITRPLRERIFICFLMGLGLFVSVASIIKTIQVQKYFDPKTPPEEFMPVSVSVATYSILELFICILAACIPALKGILEGCLRKMGVSLTDSDSRVDHSGFHHAGGIRRIG